MPTEMHFLFINQYYPPDLAPTGRYLHDLTGALVRQGHAATVICARTTYAGAEHPPARETVDGVRLLRVPATAFGRTTRCGRMLDYATFMVSVLLRFPSLRPAPDLVLGMTSPPLAPTLARTAARARGARHALWIMDIYPDVMAAHGMLSSGSACYRFLDNLWRKAVSSAALTATIAPCMAQRLQTRTEQPVAWIPLWADPSIVAQAAGAGTELRARRGWSDGELVLMYSGNMGLAHRLQEFLAAATRASRPAEERWVFAGHGPRLAEVEMLLRDDPAAGVEILPQAGHGALGEHLASADVHLVSLQPEWEGLLLPSKIQNIFASGKPVLLVGSDTGTLASWIRDADAGWCVPPDDPAAMERALRQAADPRRRAHHGAAARRYAAEFFDRQRNIARLTELLSSITEPG